MNNGDAKEAENEETMRSLHHTLNKHTILCQKPISTVQFQYTSTLKKQCIINEKNKYKKGMQVECPNVNTCYIIVTQKS